MSTGTPLRQLLAEYAVPLRVWLSPGARKQAADTLIDTLGSLAQVQVDPLSVASQLEGPAILVITADDLRRPGRDALLSLAQRALPGRIVLIGGTSDRDILMEAINQWRAFRVVAQTAPKAELVDAVRAAGETLRRDVALTTAIEDLDIETTMLDSAIGQMKDGHERALYSERQSAVSSVAAGLAKTFGEEQQALEGLVAAAQTEAIDGDFQDALQGVRTLTHLLEQFHEHAVERQSGLPVHPESVDEILQLAAGLAGLGPGTPVAVEAASKAWSVLEPYALTHLLVRLIRMARSAAPADGTLTVQSTAAGDTIEIRIPNPGHAVATSDWAGDGAGHLASSAEAISAAGGTIESNLGQDGESNILIRFPSSPQPT